MKLIDNYGWNNHFEEYTKQKKREFEIGRVVSIKGFINTLITNDGELESELSGKLLYGVELENLPKVGDWVYFIRYDTIGYIIEVLPRINELARKNPGTKTEKQVIAANVDYALIVQGLDQNFNIMRLERYLLQIIACKIKPIVILNKADLIDNPNKYRHEVAKLGRECPVYFCSTYNLSGIAELKNTVLEANKTYILIGSSGVGKSSLLNSFMDNSERVTGNISDSTGKGRHITTSRDLFQLPNGGLIIDTPGMKEFGIAFEEGQQTGGLFPLIDKLAGNCRFSDCQHLEEDGCAVLEAYNTGSLEPKVYESYLKLIKEQKHFEIKIEDKKRLGKQFGKMVREVREYRKKYKY
jgi:ribosome biogenesis GTPase / thiamine phosphate phosphatase